MEPRSFDSRKLPPSFKWKKGVGRGGAETGTIRDTKYGTEKNIYNKQSEF